MISDFNQTGQSFRSNSRPKLPSTEHMRQTSLAFSLKQRREFHDAIESERTAHGIVNKSFQDKYKVLKQTD